MHLVSFPYPVHGLGTRLPCIIKPIFLQCPGLEFQVWNKPPDGEGYQLQDGRDSQPEREHSYFGCAYVDLSPLAYGLSQITGWYNIADFGSQLQGQLKVNSNKGASR